MLDYAFSTVRRTSCFKNTRKLHANYLQTTCELTQTTCKIMIMKIDYILNPSRVALSVTHRSADRRVAGSSPGRNASRRCTRSATLWAQGIGDWELFSHGISARASMWDMQEASGRYLITGLRVWKPRSKQTNKQITLPFKRKFALMAYIFFLSFLAKNHLAC